MSIIGEAALAVSFEMIFKKIASSDLPKFVSEKEVLSEIKKWEKMLKQIRDVLDDAEEKQMTKQSVKDWLSDLQVLAYDAEDVLDEFAAEFLRRKLQGEPEASTSKVRKLFPSCCTSFSTPKAIMFNSKMDSKIKEITARLQEVTAQKNNLGLQEIVGGSSSKAWQRPPSSCLNDELKVYGRDEEKRKILDLIVRDDSTDSKVGVLPIVGMGGLGKTTLARLVYNDELVQQQFHLRAWVCVSDDFDVMRITKGILESITSKPCDLKELNQVKLEIQKELSGKKFLIVLDDVWTESYDDWIDLRPPFLDGAPGCRIIVTTRSTIVARNMGTIESQNLRHISDDDCWNLFSSHALEGRGIGGRKNLEIIRKKVISKCAGLPLAARTLGGLFRSKPEDRWEEILNSKLWSSQDGNIGVLPVLRLSYYHLPSHLKRCFSYSAIFPKDYEFTETELVLLWMAEGLIQQVDDQRQNIEDVGSEYFHELSSRSLFQASSNGGSKFVMHDLVNDLAQSVGGGASFWLEDEASSGEQSRRVRIRHCSYIISQFDGIEKFRPLYNIPHLRTFLPLSPSKTPSCYLTSDVLPNLLPKLRCLRVLSFKGYEIFQLPDSFGDLKHLRYLDLSFTPIRCLPESTVLLIKLHTLILRSCRNLKKLPSRIEDLINLSHLDIRESGLEEWLRSSVKELMSLRKLSYLNVGKISGVGLTALKNLKFLKGELRISGLENVTNVLHGREANLKEKKNLHVLSLEWEYDHKGDERFDRELLDELQPHAGLQELNLRNYGGLSFPIWVGDFSFHKLVVLKLEYCRKCTSMPKLGLLSSLRDLVIRRMSSVKSVGCEFYGEGCLDPFPSLETLCFEDMYEWEDWDSCGFEFPCLHELTIVDCPKLLGKLPNGLSKLKKLEISCCVKFTVSLPSLPMISELKIEKCNEVDFRNMVEFGSPYTVIMDDVSKFTFEAEGLVMEQLMKAKSLEVVGGFVKCFTHLPNFSCNMVKLEELVLRKWETFGQWDQIFKSLRHLTLESCPRLVSLDTVSFPSTLRGIRISYCLFLKSLPNAVGLEELEIMRCPRLISIRRSQLNSTLKRLVILRCDNLESLQLVDENQGSSSSMISLEFLSVDSCPSLVSLSSSELPSGLKKLEIINCSKLESIAENFNTTISSSLESIVIDDCSDLRYLPKDLDKLNRLHQIHIHHCKSLVSFPEGGFPATCLKDLELFDCDKLEALPDNIHSITSLQRLRIHTSIASFPAEGLPTNLFILDLVNVKFCNPLFEWGLHKLTSLTTLSINGGCADIVSFPCEDTGIVLPPSLINLMIRDFPELENLSTKGFQNLTSLKSLWLQDFPKLASFPKEGLPISLLHLFINKCPLLKQKCQKDKGQELFKIIPCVTIDQISAFDPGPGK